MSRLVKNKEYVKNMKQTADKAEEELEKGLELLSNIDKKMVTFLGGSQVSQDHEYYKSCKRTAYELGKLGYGVISGGGPGIMHAANSGATEAETISVGLKAALLSEKEANDDNVFTSKMDFHFLFTRRFILSINSEALIFYPGGYGTLNELYEYIVLMQMNMVDRVPIICVNREFWQGMFDWVRDKPKEKKLLNYSLDNSNFLFLVDSTEEVIDIVEASSSDAY